MRKKILQITSIYLVVLGILFLILDQFPNASSMWRDYVISQKVSPEKDGKNEVATYLWIKGDVAWAEYTWQTLPLGIGISKQRVDSAKFVQKQHAKDWYKTYKDNRY